MKKTRPKFRRFSFRNLCFSLVVVFLFTSTTFAQQFDAPYYDYQKKNKAKWAAQDKQINSKLAALEKKFGKKPNIIYILTDDIGWGELAAIRYENFKIHIKPGHGGLPGMDFYNIKRDPGEKYGQLYPGLFAVTPNPLENHTHQLSHRRHSTRAFGRLCGKPEMQGVPQ